MNTFYNRLCTWADNMPMPTTLPGLVWVLGVDVVLTAALVLLWPVIALFHWLSQMAGTPEPEPVFTN